MRVYYHIFKIIKIFEVINKILFLKLINSFNKFHYLNISLFIKLEFYLLFYYLIRNRYNLKNILIILIFIFYV